MLRLKPAYQKGRMERGISKLSLIMIVSSKRGDEAVLSECELDTLL